MYGLISWTAKSTRTFSKKIFESSKNKASKSGRLPLILLLEAKPPLHRVHRGNLRIAQLLKNVQFVMFHKGATYKDILSWNASQLRCCLEFIVWIRNKHFQNASHHTWGFINYRVLYSIWKTPQLYYNRCFCHYCK